MAIYPPSAVQEAARWGLEQRAIHERGGTRKTVAIAHMLACGMPLDDEAAEYVEAVLATTFVDDDWFPGSKGYPSGDRILASLVGGELGWTGQKQRVLAADQVVASGTIDLKRLTKKLLAVQEGLTEELTALGEAALIREIEAIRPTLPDFTATLSAASTSEVLAGIAAAFGGLKFVATRRIAAARNRILDAIVAVTGLSLTAAKRHLREFDVARGFNPKQSKEDGVAAVAATLFVERLRAAIEQAVRDPESITGLTPPGETPDPALAGAHQAARESIAVASGQPPIPPDASPEVRRSWLAAVAAGLLSPALLNAVVSGSPAGTVEEDGVATVDILANTDAFIWRWGPGILEGGTFKPHFERNGKPYSGLEDPALSTEGNGFLSQIAPYDHAGIHAFCGCHHEPLWVGQDANTPTNVNVAVAASATPWRITAASEHADSAMIALTIPLDIAEAIAVEGGLKPEKMHVTLVYLGDVANLDKERIVRALGEVNSRHHGPLSGSIGGIGRFPGSHKEGLDAVWVPVDVPGVSELFVEIMQALIHNGLDAKASSHGYTPHLTLAYVGHEEPTPPVVPKTDVSWGNFTLYFGNERIEFPFGDPEDEEEIQAAVVRRRKRAID